MSRARIWTAYAFALLVGMGVFVFDDVVSPPELPPTSPTPAAVTEPVAGSFVCVVGSGLPGTDLDVIAARPGSAGAAPAATEMVTIEGGTLASASLPPVFPNTDGRMPVEGGAEAATLVRWSDGPVAVARQWRWTDAEDLPRGTVAGPCARPSGATWLIPGMSTVGGEEARVRIANPYRTDATIAMGFRAPEGVEEPIALRNLTVEARSVLEIVVNDLLPERADLAAIIEVATGRVAVEGYQIARSSIGGVDGASLLSATTQVAETWTVPWVVDGEDRSSWLWILNPSDRTAPIELTMHTGSGGEVPDGLAEVSIPPGEVRRIDLRGTFPAEHSTAAVTARSNGVPVVVSAGVRFGGDDPSATGFAVQLGAAAPSRSWVVSGGAPAGRDEALRVVNPTGSEAVYSLALFDGVTVRRPEELQDVTVPPGAVSAVDVVERLGSVGGWSAFVTTSTGEVVVGRVGHGGEDALHLVASLGTPASAWGAQVSGLAGSHEPGLVRRLSTELGISPDDRRLPPTPSSADALPGT